MTSGARARFSSGVSLAEPAPGMPGAHWSRVAIEDLIDPSFLTREERALFDTLTTDKRRREWLAGRRAARAVLRAVGAGACSVLRNDEGAPRVVGPGGEAVDLAITHGQGQAAALACRRDGPFPHVGIDWVDARDLPRLKRVVGRITDPTEKALCEGSNLALQVAWGAREAITKATRTGMFMFALSRVHLVGIAPDGRAKVDLEGAEVGYLKNPDGSVVVLARVSAACRAAANAVARGHEEAPE